MDEQDQDPPRWIPYSPPPADGWERTRDILRRLVFPIVVLLFGLGLAGGLYWLSQSQQGRSSINVNVTSAFDSLETPGESAGESGAAQVTIQSRPPGASVWINEDSVGTTPINEHSLSPGVYFLSLQSEGYFDTDTVAVLSENANSELSFSLEARPGTDLAPEPGATVADQSQEEIPPEPGAEPAPPTGTTDEGLAQQFSPVPSEEPSSDTSSQEEAPTPVGSIQITSEPAGAEVVVNGSPQGQTPLTLDELSPGSREVELQMEGYEPWSETVDVEANTTTEVEGTLQPQMGQLRVLARPWGTIYIDDSLHVRQTDIWYQTEMPVGSHQITAVHPSLGKQSQTVELQANEQTEVVIDFREEEPEE